MGEVGSESCDLHKIILEEYEKQKGNNSDRKPKRVLQFSDGVLEEYSSDDETDASGEKQDATTINPKNLNWLPWAWYQTVSAGIKILEGCDTAGEYLAELFGITTPKYQFEIDEYYRIKAAEQDMLRKKDPEMGGWSEHNENNLISKSELLKNFSAQNLNVFYTSSPFNEKSSSSNVWRCFFNYFK